MEFREIIVSTQVREPSGGEQEDLQKLHVTSPIIGAWQYILYIYIFFVINIFLFFSHITQHSIQNITKQNIRHILNISKSSQKGGREGRTIKTQKSLLYTITYIQVQVQVLFVTYTTIQGLYNQQWNVSQVRSTDSANIVEYNTREVCIK